MPVGWVRTPVRFFAVCGPKNAELSLPVRECFPIDDVLLRSGDIRDQVAQLCEIAPKFDVFGLPNFGGEREGLPIFLTEFYKNGSPANM